MDICEVRDERPDVTYLFVMEYCVKKILDETHKEIYECYKETNQDAMKMVIEECLYDTSPVEMEEGVNYRNYDKNEKGYEETEVEFPYDTYLVVMEEGVCYRNDDKNESNYVRKKE